MLFPLQYFMIKKVKMKYSSQLGFPVLHTTMVVNNAKPFQLLFYFRNLRVGWGWKDTPNHVDH